MTLKQIKDKFFSNVEYNIYSQHQHLICNWFLDNPQFAAKPNSEINEVFLKAALINKRVPLNFTRWKITRDRSLSYEDIKQILSTTQKLIKLQIYE